MSMMEYCDIREGRLVPTYGSFPIRCDWCEEMAESVAQAGSCWVCPNCIGEMRGETKL